MSKRRVVVTGLGLVCPLGNSVDEAWPRLIAGESGIRSITAFDVSTFPTRFGGSVLGFDVSAYVSVKEARKMEQFIHYGIAASLQAFNDAGLAVTEDNADRIGIIVGSGIGGLPGIERGYGAFLEGGARKVSPFFVPSNIVNMAGGNVSVMLGLKGPNYAIVSACSSGSHSIGDAARIIAYGDADVMIAGGAEMATCPTGLGGFSSARALSTRNDDPAAASRPWDRDRDGFVLSDGAGVVVIEELEHALARGARIHAELVGFGMSSDAYHMTSPAPGGEGAARSMLNALKDANLVPEQVDYINAHGTSTPQGDRAETEAVKRVFGEHATRLAMSSTKSAVGHMLGAAGGAEAVFCILALRDQMAPPTINLDNPDEGCDLDYIPHHARPMTLDVVLSNSFGFGGTNSTLIFKRYTQ
jgi:3-oxoacyl-[acyl-carrier-protein] synthase II